MQKQLNEYPPGIRLLLIFKRAIMNIKNISAGLILLSAVGATFAVTPYPVESTFVTAPTHISAIPDSQQQPENRFNSIGDDYPLNVVTNATLTRQQVQAELRSANSQHMNNPSYAELVFLR